MELDKIFVSVIGTGFIGFIWWFFFGKKEEVFAVQESKKEGSGGERINIVVEGGYKPSTIKLKTGIETTLNVLRKDTNSCLEEIVLPDFKIRQYLPVGEEVQIKIKPTKEGIFRFQCGMNMFHGKIIVD